MKQSINVKPPKNGPVIRATLQKGDIMGGVKPGLLDVVGLFGVCGKTTWRQGAIERLSGAGVGVFNPQVENWTPECAEIESKHLASDKLLLMVINSETTAYGSLAEVGFAIINAIRNGQKVGILIEDHVEPGQELNPKSDANRARKLVKAHLGKLLEGSPELSKQIFVAENMEKLLDWTIQAAKQNQAPEQLPSQRVLSFIKENFPAVQISGNEVQDVLEKMTDGKHVIVALVGYCPPTKFDETLGNQLVRNGIEEIAQKTGKIPIVVSGATSVGVLKFGYDMADEKGWPAVGVACERAMEHPLANLGLSLIYGPNWGEESPLFTGLQKTLKQMGQDVYFLKVGGGKQSERERDMVREAGVTIVEKALPKIETPPA